MDGIIPLEKRKKVKGKMQSIKLIVIALIIGVVGCKKDYVKLNDDEIRNYISSNNLVAEKTAEGLYYVINEEGSGERPQVSDEVTVHYSGYLTDGTIFDSS